LAASYDGGGRHGANTSGWPSPKPRDITGSAQWKKDIRRREDLESRGWRIIVITSDGLYDDPQDTLDRIRRVLLDRGETVGRRRPGVEWQRCFPVRAAA
jgi:hypothetical protein